MTVPAHSKSHPTRLGDFVIVGVLGEGGSGIVYDARWGHREIAMKVLHPVLVATEKERDQFLAEARRLAEIHHAGVVKVLAVGQTPDSDGARPFLAMEKLRGETLAARLARGPLPVTLALELFGQLCDAVEAFHGRGLVHRDLKPENVVLVGGVDDREHAVLLDFGIAKELSSAPSTTTQEGGVRGTPAYMAPERFFGQAASVSTDVYELAVTLFAMLAGRLPWDDVGDPEVRLDPRRLADVAPHVPAALDLEVRRALSTRAQNRPAGAADLRSAVMGAAGMQWAPRATVDVKSGPIQLPGPAPVSVNPHAPTAVGHTRRIKKGPIIASLVGLAAIASGIGIAAHFLSAPGKKIESTEAKREPESPEPVPGPAPDPVPAAEPVPAADLDAAKRNLVTALAHLPDDELFAFGAQLAELESDSTLQPVLGLFADSQPGRLLRAEANLTDCDLDVRKRADWIIFGGPADESAVDLIVSGRWTRAEIEQCLKAALRASSAIQDGRFTTFEGADRTVGWLDDHTLYLSSRPGADRAWMTERLDDTTPPKGALGSALGELDATAAIWFAGDESGARGASLTGDTEMTGMWGHLGATSSEVALDLKVRYPSKKLADQARAELEESLGGMGMDASMGHIRIEADAERPEVIRVDVGMSRMIAGVVVQSLAQGGGPFAP